MINTETNTTDICAYRLGELHAFEAAGARFLYLVAGGAIFEVDRAAGILIDLLKEREAPRDRLLADLITRGVGIGEAEELIDEMAHARVIVSHEMKPEPVADPPA